MLILLQVKVSCLDVILTLGSFRGTECLTFGSHAWIQVLNTTLSDYSIAESELISSQDTKLGLPSTSQMLLSTEPLEL